MRALFASLALFALATPAAADPVSLDSLAGAWTFETIPHETTGCVIRSEVNATPEGDYLAMQLQAHETCAYRNGPVNATEQCRGRLHGAELRVRCVVVRADTPTYNADQFTLTPLSADEMSGRLWDQGLWNGAVQWRRPATTPAS